MNDVLTLKKGLPNAIDAGMPLYPKLVVGTRLKDDGIYMSNLLIPYQIKSSLPLLFSPIINKLNQGPSQPRRSVYLLLHHTYMAKLTGKHRHRPVINTTVAYS